MKEFAAPKVTISNGNRKMGGIPSVSLPPVKTCAPGCTMCQIAERQSGTMFLAFTKRYDIVNDYISGGHSIPSNFKLIFSEWPGMSMDNPHGMPVAHVIFRGSEPMDDWKICGGNCTECACRGVGCWELSPGENIAFYEH